MANTKINRKIFEKDFGKLDEKMQDKIAMFSTTIESVSDSEFEINVNPNRPDLLSYQGFKRAFSGFLGKETGLKNYKINPPEKDYSVKIDSSLKEIRPCTACAIVKNIEFSDDKIKEIIDIQEKLHSTIGRKRKKLAIGIYPLEKIKLPIVFTALEPDKIKFIPLESPREMTGLQILQRHPAGREYAHLLSGKTKFPIFIDANNNVLSMPPIINSEMTGKITENTKDIFIECSGSDFEICKKCINIITSALADMGGKVFQMNLTGLIKAQTPDFTPEKNKLSIENTNKLLGLNLSEKEIKNNLEKMGHSYNKGEVESPAWRTDILHEVDLIEDVAIAYGYEKFIPEIPSNFARWTSESNNKNSSEVASPKISTIGQEDPRETFKRKISEVLSGLGFLEISNYHLTKPKDQFEKMGISEKEMSSFIELEESKTDYTILRKDLSHYALKILSENIDSEYPQKIFETGRVFRTENNEIIEEEKFCCASAPGNFTELKQVLEYVSRMLNLNLKLIESESPEKEFIEGRTADVYLDDKRIGKLGEIHPRILREWKIKMPVVLFEIELEDIFKKMN